MKMIGRLLDNGPLVQMNTTEMTVWGNMKNAIAGVDMANPMEMLTTEPASDATLCKFLDQLAQVLGATKRIVITTCPLTIHYEDDVVIGEGRSVKFDTWGE